MFAVLRKKLLCLLIAGLHPWLLLKAAYDYYD
jgi:hypothetical protein